MAYRRGNSTRDLAKLSPDYNDEEIPRIWDGNEFSEHYLLREVLSLDLTGIRKLGCPLIILAGRHDFDVNSQVAAVRSRDDPMISARHALALPQTPLGARCPNVSRDSFLFGLPTTRPRQPVMS